jgi:hypothetical protein
MVEAQSIAKILGLSTSIHTYAQLESEVSKGLPKKSLKRLATRILSKRASVPVLLYCHKLCREQGSTGEVNVSALPKAKRQAHCPCTGTCRARLEKRRRCSRVDEYTTSRASGTDTRRMLYRRNLEPFRLKMY